ncbi:YlmC/YmxH family sporulation protein [Clostridium niameyense]|uniref:YlmC/YmxH family sporulation protein n=1 Tax=Clostridium niameyense TaxID=1622073 RepID=A0A6M0R728_9CLOT|nr:YlmC/YmxH family sporulation protein [Clostridium niameyense]NEZ45991.1 YlmC/YmxH family sporulation protein [Clostridium niameyense]
MEEMGLYSIGNLRSMEVIDINTGSKLGYIKDLVIDCDEYKIVSIIIPSRKLSLFSKKDDIEIGWDKIKKLGVDVILVEGDEYMMGDN